MELQAQQGQKVIQVHQADLWDQKDQQGHQELTAQWVFRVQQGQAEQTVLPGKPVVQDYKVLPDRQADRLVLTALQDLRDRREDRSDQQGLQEIPEVRDRQEFRDQQEPMEQRDKKEVQVLMEQQDYRGQQV